MFGCGAIDYGIDKLDEIRFEYASLNSILRGGWQLIIPWTIISCRCHCQLEEWDIIVVDIDSRDDDSSR